jgi:hypothetical protein
MGDDDTYPLRPKPELGKYQWGRELTHEESLEYLKQQKELSDLHNRIIGKCSFPSRILGMIDDNPKHRIFINPPFTIKSDAIPGYVIEYPGTSQKHDVKVDKFYEGQHSLQFFDFVMYINSKQWQEEMDTSSSSVKKERGQINVSICCQDSGDIAYFNLLARESFMNTLSSRVPPYHYPGVSLFKIEEGQEVPGDKCLVPVHSLRMLSPPWGNENIGYLFMGDVTMYFIRGNVAVKLSSNYKNLGCMDLARKLDTFLLEETKRQAEGNTKVLKNHEF